jgi:hypothetical protein
MLVGSPRVKPRVQHPEVKPRKDRKGCPWVFRYRLDEIQADGTVITLRKYEAIGPSKGEGAITKRQAEVKHDHFLARLNAPTTEAAIEQVAATGIALFKTVAEMYRTRLPGADQPDCATHSGKRRVLPAGVHCAEMGPATG